MKRIFTLLTFLLIFQITKAQNDLHFSHFMYSYMTYNPAHAGSSNNIIANLVARQQWTGFEQAPSTQFLSGHTYLDAIHGGIGAVLINDQLGFEKSISLKLNYAFHIKVSEKATVSLGAAGGFISKSLNGSKLIYQQTGDQNAITATERKTKPDVTFGAELNTSKFTFGIASTHIDQSIGNSNIYKIPRHLYTYAKYKYKASDQLEIIPSVLVRSTIYISQFEINNNFLYQGKYWAGISYRHNEGLCGLAGLNINQNFKIGYSYDFNVGPMNGYTNGSHEIMLAGVFKGFNRKKHNYKTPRFFN